MNLSPLLIPALFIFSPPRPNPDGTFWVRGLMAVLMSWWMTLVFRLQFSLPAIKKIARENGAPTYDGIGMNAAVIVMGWVPPFFVTAVMATILHAMLQKGRSDNQ